MVSAEVETGAGTSSTVAGAGVNVAVGVETVVSACAAVSAGSVPVGAQTNVMVGAEMDVVAGSETEVVAVVDTEVNMSYFGPAMGVVGDDTGVVQIGAVVSTGMKTVVAVGTTML